MEIKDLLEYWRAALGLLVFVVITTASFMTWANAKEEALKKEFEEEMVLMKAQSALIHNDYYQQGRIERKEIEIKENQRELNVLLRGIGDDEPTPREHREIEYLDNEIIRLRKEIDEIRAILANK